MRIDASRQIGQERRVLWGVLGTGKRVRDEASGLAWLLGLLCDLVLQTNASYSGPLGDRRHYGRTCNDRLFQLFMHEH